MTTVDYQQSSFNAGELSPLVKGREGLEKYKSGLKTCENALVLAHGPVTSRGGFRYIGDVKTHSKKVRLIPFEFSEEQSYVLEMGDEYMRVWMDGGQVVTPDDDTLLLLHMNGANGSIVFTDKSNSEHVVTANGNASVDTTDPVFTYGDDAGNLILDGVGDYLSVADDAEFTFGTDPLTIDTWFYFDTVVGAKCVYYQGHSTSAYLWIALWIDPDTDEIYFAYSAGGSAGQIKFTYSTGFAIDTWYHLAVIRGWGGNANDWMVTINGVACGSTQTANMTLPNYDEDPQIGAAKVTFFPDLSSKNRRFTINGDVINSITEFKWGNGSLYFDGTGDFLSHADHADFDPINMTISFWVKHSDHAGTEYYIGQYLDVNNWWGIYHVDGSGLKFYYVRNSDVKADLSWGTEITDTNWHHIAVILDDPVGSVYLDGVRVLTGVFGQVTSVGTFAIGALSTGDSPFQGYIDDVFIDRDGFPFGAPSQATITIPTGKYVSDANTVLLIRGDVMDTDGGYDELRISSVARWTENFSVNTQEYPGAGGSTPYELATTPWTEDQVGALKWAGVNDVLYVVHPNVAVHKISRTDHTVWTCDIVEWEGPPWKAINETATTLTSATYTVGTARDLVASAALFSQNHVGAYFKFNDGWGIITGVTDSENAVWEILDALTGAGPTADWYLSAWNGVDGHPSAITFFEDRLCLSGAGGEPTTVRFSETGDFENMTVDVADSDPMAYTLLSQKHNKVLWLVGGKKLFVGTSGAEFWMSGIGANMPITPTSVLARRESTIGSEDIQPVTIGTSVIFIQRAGKTVNLWKYDYLNDSFEATDLGILAEHLFKDYSIVDAQYAQDPDHIVWTLRSDGILLGLTYMRDHEVAGWHKHVTASDDGNSTIESFAVIPGTSQGVPMDELWLLVNRTIDGSTVRYIEILTPRFGNFTLQYATNLDSCITYIGSPATVFSGADHLEGETVNIIADGAVFNTTISGGGFTLATAASVVTAGLPYTVTIEFMVALLTEMLQGVVTGKRKRIVELLIMMYETCQLSYGVDASNMLDAWNTSNLTDAVLNDDYIKVEVDGNPEYEPTLMLTQEYPYPFTLLGVVETIEVED